jgi:hypothetical protein
MKRAQWLFFSIEETYPQQDQAGKWQILKTYLTAPPRKPILLKSIFKIIDQQLLTVDESFRGRYLIHKFPTFLCLDLEAIPDPYGGTCDGAIKSTISKRENQRARVRLYDQIGKFGGDSSLVHGNALRANR